MLLAFFLVISVPTLVFTLMGKLYKGGQANLLSHICQSVEGLYRGLVELRQQQSLKFFEH